MTVLLGKMDVYNHPLWLHPISTFEIVKCAGAGRFVSSFFGIFFTHAPVFIWS